MKRYYALIIILMIVGIGLISFLRARAISIEKVIEIKGSYLKLDSGKVVRLACVTVPYLGSPNYREYMENNLKEMVLNKKIRLKRVLKSSRGKNYYYPDVDLVIVYIGDENINEKLLREGMGFYNFDYVRGRNKYQKLQVRAKKEKLGVWKEENRLKVLFVTKKGWGDLHYPECPVVAKLKDKEKIKYYTAYPYAYMGKSLAIARNDYCDYKFIHNTTNKALLNIKNPNPFLSYEEKKKLTYRWKRDYS